MKTVSVIVVIALLTLGSGVTGYLIGNSTLPSFVLPPQLSIQNPGWTSSSGQNGSCGWGYTSAFGDHISRPWVTCVVTVAAGGSGSMTFNVTNSRGEAYLVFDDSSSAPLTVFFTQLNCQGSGGTAGFCDIGGHSTGEYFVTFDATPGNYTSVNATLTVELGILSSSS